MARQYASPCRLLMKCAEVPDEAETGRRRRGRPREEGGEVRGIRVFGCSCFLGSEDK